jgi:capsular exopolysaccharide synthesis family protein
LLQRSKENDVTVAGTPNNINVVDYALPPREPVGPHRLLAVTLSALIAVLFGVCLAIFLEYLDNTVRSADDVEAMLQLPALAVIPAVRSGAIRRRVRPSIAEGNASNRNAPGHPELLLDVDPRSSIAEAYKQLRTSILLSTAGRAPKTLLVTSSSPGEGKTTTAANTAISLAQIGARVLVIDADMRSPRIHTVFNIANVAGLSTALSRDSSEADILSMIDSMEDGKLHVMTSGPIPPNPAELLGSKSMKLLLKKLETRFDHIVIDSPPIANVTDGVLIASLVDGVILVVHGGRSTRDLVRRARQLLRSVGARICGVVLNNVKTSDNSYYYQGHYSRRYDSENSSPQKPVPLVN